MVVRAVVIVIATLPAGQPQARRPGVDFPAARLPTADHPVLSAGPTTGTGPAADSGGMAPIQIHGLVKRYGPVTAVDNLSFEVQPGTVTGFLGPNGAGKTTTLRMLLGLVTPDAGRATINGRRYTELAEPLHQVGAVLEASFHPGRTARAHLRIQALSADADPSRADDVLRLVGLADAADRRIGGFSLGMRQRLGLATAVLADPQLLILDEPANGLDPEGIRWLRGMLRGFAAEGGTVLVSSHMLAEVAQSIDSAVIVHHGRLVVQAPVAELTADGTDLETAFFHLTREAV
jgi:ABC-2 type transport system ATP-binding protein